MAPKARDYSVIINNDVVLTITLNERSLEHHCNFVSIYTTKLFASSIRDYWFLRWFRPIVTIVNDHYISNNGHYIVVIMSIDASTLFCSQFPWRENTHAHKDIQSECRLKYSARAPNRKEPGSLWLDYMCLLSVGQISCLYNQFCRSDIMNLFVLHPCFVVNLCINVHLEPS